jgi:hypothetical protein
MPSFSMSGFLPRRIDAVNPPRASTTIIGAARLRLF